LVFSKFPDLQAIEAGCSRLEDSKTAFGFVKSRLLSTGLSKSSKLTNSIRNSRERKIFHDTNESVIFKHMLVLRASSDTSGAWERVGILNTEEEVGSPLVFEEKFFTLV
jgi:hypothetical protein